MPHHCYAREGAVIFRFQTRTARDAWIDAAKKATPRAAVESRDVPVRLRTGRHVDGLELRDGPEPPRAR
jgi:hypothetical protein